MPRMVRSLAVAALIACVALPTPAAPSVHAFEIFNSQGHRSLLIPSLHVPAEGIVQPSSAVMETEGSFLVVEHFGPAPSAGEADNGWALWAKALTFPEHRTYVRRAACARASAEAAEEALRRPSVQVANQYAYTSCKVPHLASRDDILAESANRFHRRRVALEEYKWVERQRHKVSLQAQSEAFRWILNREVDDVLVPVVQAFNIGDFESVAELTSASWGSADSARGAYEPMVAERNVHWMETLPRLLAEGGAVINVGAMHVPGPQGLVQLLRAAGFRVVPIELPAER